ncbi:MAG: hypothetical protein M0R80_13240 [Proteobacteria bacterium]|jgi:hypothetical protein|nr:hypothetical protein [Pseudomonadota bacterium]
MRKKKHTLEGMYLIIEEMCKRVDINRPELPDKRVLNRLPKSVVDEGEKWLKAIFENEYLAVYSIRKLLSEDIWKFYDAFKTDFKDHREVKLIKERAELLERALMSLTRPDLFKPKAITQILKEMRRGHLKKTC